MGREREKTGDADQCPSKATLEAFVVGNVAADEMEDLAEHLKSCKRCESRLEALDGYHDDLLAQLGTMPECSDDPAETLPADLLAAAESAYEEVHGGQGRHGAVDAGRSMALALADGPYRLGRFELLEELGAGSFGNVFRARDTELDRIVAIKVLRSSSLGSEQETERFLREARSAAQLKHPHIVALYDTGRTADGVFYLVTEYVPGETLEQHLQKTRIEPQAAARFVSAVAEALHYAHCQGVIHRDIKPANLMLDADAQPHIMDFGLAKREADEATMTQEGDVMGTPAYMSPEQARGEGHHVDANTDTYSLGAVLYELLTGERPFQGNRRMIMLAVLEEEPRSPRKLNDGIPRDLDTI